MKIGFKLKKYILIIFILFLWGLGSQMELWSPYLLPGPLNVWEAFKFLLNSGELFKHIFVSFTRVLKGFTIASLTAIPLGILFGVHKNIYEYFELVFEFFRHVPPLALVPLLILWFGIGERSKLMIIVLASFFPILLNTISGVESCSSKFIDVGRVFDLKKGDIFKKIVIPWALPNILLGMRLGLGYSWRAIIGAEMVAASSGLGYLILDGQQMSRSSVVIVGILSIGIIGSLSDMVFEKLTGRFDY